MTSDHFGQCPTTTGTPPFYNSANLVSSGEVGHELSQPELLVSRGCLASSQEEKADISGGTNICSCRQDGACLGSTSQKCNVLSLVNGQGDTAHVSLRFLFTKHTLLSQQLHLSPELLRICLAAPPLVAWAVTAMNSAVASAASALSCSGL